MVLTMRVPWEIPGKSRPAGDPIPMENRPIKYRLAPAPATSSCVYLFPKNVVLSRPTNRPTRRDSTWHVSYALCCIFFNYMYIAQTLLLSSDLAF